jgi:hypothetical protein
MTVKLNAFTLGFLSAITLMVVAGCSSVFDNNNGIFGGKAQTSEHQITSQIHATETAQAQSNSDKLEHIGAFAKGGVEYSLSKDTNPTPQVDVAKQMNERVEALAGKPNFNEVVAIQGIVDDLLSQEQKQEEAGQKLLTAKDNEIAQIQTDDQKLDQQREMEINQAIIQANANALAADKANQTLSQMDKWFGLGAVWYGVKKFVVDSAWVLGIGSVLFLILRLLASSNPIAGAIFSVFDQIGSWAVGIISTLFPKAVSLAGNVAVGAYNDVKGALTTLVDSIETVKLQSSSSGQPASIETLLNTAELSMTPADKQLIENIKIELGWIKPSTTTTVAPLKPVTGSFTAPTGSVITTPVTISVPVSGSLPVSGSVA